MNFIEIYDNALSPQMCKSIIEFFDKAPSKYLRSGTVGKILNKSVIDKTHKDSIDLTLDFNNWTLPDTIINTVLAKYLQDYKTKHPQIDEVVAPWQLTPRYNIQKYNPKQGYFYPHCENDGTLSRVLVWMLYLNTVTDKGGTRFTNYDITTNAVEGRLILWPAYWTHTHHGIASPTQTKYIATGWFECINQTEV